MKQRTANKPEDLDEIATKIRNLRGHLPVVVTVTEGSKIRTNGQNARYWDDVDHFLGQIRETIWRLSEMTGYTEAETRWILAAELPVEYRSIMYSLTKEGAHEALKHICEIPTSTRLGTKAFKKFETILEQVMSEIIGYLNAVMQRVAA